MGKTKKRNQFNEQTPVPSTVETTKFSQKNKEEIRKKEIQKEIKNQNDLKSKIYHYIGSWAQAEHFVKDNKYILHGYRVNFDSPKKIFKR
jgi:hypothetical protein